MKAKLFAILGLIIAVAGMSLALSSPVEAKGEKYKWIDKDTIEASGGLYKNVNAAKNGVINFTRASGFKISSKGSCDITMTIVPSVDNASGTLTTKGCDEPAKDFDRSFTISDVDKGPPVGTNPGTPTTDPGTDDTKATSCAISGIGWIVCPVMNFLSKVVDGAYSVVSALMLVQPLMTTNTDTGNTTAIYQAWSVMRNIANVAFVIAFLFIIFSQITSIGITNYGIKKMLPRLIISAVLVNVSFWICAAAVDLSNIVGSSIVDVFKGIGASMSLTSDYDPTKTGGSGWAYLANSLLAGTLATVALLYIGLSALLPMLLAALIAVIIALLVLALRQALIVVLIIVAPIAFVLRLLPNTESLYKKWQSMGSALLIGFPGIALLFGGSELASQIITSTAKGNKLEFVIQIMGAGVAVVPLAVTPFIIKAAGVPANLVSKLQGATGKGPIAKLQKSAEDFRGRQEGRREIRALNGSGLARATSLGKYGRAAKRNAINAGVANETKRAQSAFVAGTAIDNEAFRNRLAGGRTFGANATPQALQRALSNAVRIQTDIEVEEVKAASAVIKDLNLGKEQLRALSMGGQVGNLDGSNRAIRAAAMQNVVDTHDVEGVNALLDDVGNMNVKDRASLADSLKNSKEKPTYVSQGAIANIRHHGETQLDSNGNEVTIQAENSTKLAIEAIRNNSYSVENIATGDRQELEFVAGVAANPANGTDNTKFAANAQAALTDSRYSGRISKNAEVVDSISRL
jgi:hypothetical protein